MAEFESLRDYFVQRLGRNNEERALTFFRNGNIETEISYTQLYADSNRLADELLKLGVNNGDRVVLYLEKSLFFVVAHIALQALGAVGVPLNPGFKKGEMLYLLRDSDPKLILAGVKQEKIIREIGNQFQIVTIDTNKPYQDLQLFDSASKFRYQVKIHLDDPALIIYTSGTTGKPKGAVLTQQNLVDDARKIIRMWEIGGSDVLCHSLPLFHIHGLCFALNTSLLAGAHILMLDNFSADTVAKMLGGKGSKYKCTLFMGVPSMYTRLLDHLQEEAVDLSHIRLWASGSAPLPPKEFARIKRVLGKEPVEREGMTETGMNFSNPLRGLKKAGSIGIPMPGVQVRIVNPETNQDVEPGRTGEIWLRGPSIMQGYWRKPEETFETFFDDWFRTGDLGHLDSDGYYFITDRRKHIIISGGENISPKELEAVINQCEGVTESSVVGIPDDRWGERVVAAVVRKSGAKIEPDEIYNFCKEHLLKWKCPKEVIFVSELPRNAMGKILKEDVKKLFEH